MTTTAVPAERGKTCNSRTTAACPYYFSSLPLRVLPGGSNLTAAGVRDNTRCPILTPGTWHLALGLKDRCRSLSPYYGTVNAPRGVLAMPAAIKVGDTVLMPDTPLVGVTGGDGGEF